MRQLCGEGFLSTPSARRATVHRGHCAGDQAISIHALREEGDLQQRQPQQRRLISIHALREEGDMLIYPVGKYLLISIHALREEGDNCARRLYRRARYFYPRPPRGGRHDIQFVPHQDFDFYPRPPRGGRPYSKLRQNPKSGISIHALREEGDRADAPFQKKSTAFLSTPSARRATGRNNRPAAPSDISIHALREEGDLLSGL